MSGFTLSDAYSERRGANGVLARYPFPPILAFFV